MRGDWLVIADDLTGACDSAVHFAARGRRTVAVLASEADRPERASKDAQVVALSTESRDVDIADAADRLRRVAESVGVRGRAIFKKIDSTLRGNTGAEIVAAMEAFGCDAAVVNPAFPAMGRVVEKGFLRVGTDPSFRPIEMTEWLRAHGAERCVHVEAGGVAAALDGGARFISMDAVRQDDLVCLASEKVSIGRPILWAGSAGLAAALASLESGADAQAMPVQSPGPVLFCLGSDHPVTMEQQQRLLQKCGAVLIDAGSAAAGDVNAALHCGHVVVRIVRGQVPIQRLCRLIAECHPSGLVLSGGDTASAVFRAAGAQSIELRREFAAGIPAGILRGGGLEGTVVITKSGGFGAPDDLIHIADCFYG